MKLLTIFETIFILMVRQCLFQFLQNPFFDQPRIPLYYRYIQVIGLQRYWNYQFLTTICIYPLGEMRNQLIHKQILQINRDNTIVQNYRKQGQYISITLSVHYLPPPSNITGRVSFFNNNIYVGQLEWVPNVQYPIYRHYNIRTNAVLNELKIVSSQFQVQVFDGICDRIGKYFIKSIMLRHRPSGTRKKQRRKKQQQQKIKLQEIQLSVLGKQQKQIESAQSLQGAVGGIEQILQGFDPFKKDEQDQFEEQFLSQDSEFQAMVKDLLRSSSPTQFDYTPLRQREPDFQ